MNMKKFIIYALACVMALPLLTSCEKMLEEDSFGRPTTDDMLRNEENVVSLVGQAYADLKFMHDHWGSWGVNLLTADEGLCPVRKGGDWNDGGYWKNLNTHKWNPYGKAFENIWNCTIAGAVLCNNLLQTLYMSEESMSPEVYAMYVGELEVLRSYYYFLLFDSFGRVPYMEDYSSRHETLLAPEVTWAHLVSCLEKNAPNMAVVTDANRANYLGRCTQGMAYMLLARLYLNAESYGCTPENVMAATRTVDSKGGKKGGVLLNEVGIKISSPNDFYTNALRCCNKVIASNSYSIEKDFFTNFLIDNGGSRENIFTIVEDGTTNNERDAYGSKNKMRINLLTLHYVFQDAFKVQMKIQPWNGFVARPDFLAIYNDHDVRGPGYEGLGTNDTHHWGWFLGPVCKEGETTPMNDLVKDEKNQPVPVILVSTINSLDSANRNDGARMYKYEIDKNAKYTYCENDFVLFRYADLVMMKKEAVLRGGTDDMPGSENDAIDAIKQRTFAYSGGAADFDAAYPDAFTTLDGGLTGGLLAERGRELAWECCRRRDLIRFGQFENVQYVENKDATRRWFPIPFSVLEKSYIDEKGNPIWTQNPGY